MGRGSVEFLLHHIKGGQVRWFGHLIRMPPGPLTVQVFQGCLRRPRDKPETCWRNSVSKLAWKCLGIPMAELKEVAGKKEVDAEA